MTHTPVFLIPAKHFQKAPAGGLSSPAAKGYAGAMPTGCPVIAHRKEWVSYYMIITYLKFRLDGKIMRLGGDAIVLQTPYTFVSISHVRTDRMDLTKAASINSF